MPGQRHRPSEQSRGMVAAMVVNGVPQADIAKAMQLDPKTLRKFYREALDHATIMLCARVARNLGKIATTGRGAPAVSACRYILGCKSAWRDTARLEVDAGAGAMAYFADSENAREIIRQRLDQLAEKNAEIEAYRGPPGSAHFQ